MKNTGTLRIRINTLVISWVSVVTCVIYFCIAGFFFPSPNEMSAGEFDTFYGLSVIIAAIGLASIIHLINLRTNDAEVYEMICIPKGIYKRYIQMKRALAMTGLWIIVAVLGTILLALATYFYLFATFVEVN